MKYLVRIESVAERVPVYHECDDPNTIEFLRRAGFIVDAREIPDHHFKEESRALAYAQEFGHACVIGNDGSILRELKKGGW